MKDTTTSITSHTAPARLSEAHARIESALRRIGSAREQLEAQAQRRAEETPTLPIELFRTIDTSIAKVEKTLAQWPQNAMPLPMQESAS